MKIRLRTLYKPIGISIVCIVLLVSIGWISKVVSQVNEDSACAALWSSADGGETTDVERLLKEGVNPDCQHGTAMKRARLKGHEDVIAILKHYGAKD